MALTPHDDLSASGRGIQPDGGLKVQSHPFDEELHLRLRAAQPQRSPTAAQALGEHGQIEHQRRIRRPQLRQVDDDIASGAESGGQRATTFPNRRGVFISHNSQHGVFRIERDH